MVDGLTEEERALAWISAWHPSFDGVAIVEKDGTFRSVNPQFAELLGVTPGELIGNKFQDITPNPVRKLDEKNAQMVADGVIGYYIMSKTYDFGEGHTVDVHLLVTRVPKETVKPFKFFVSRIMTNEDTSSADQGNELSELGQPSQNNQTFLEFITENSKLLAGLGVAGATFIIALLEFFSGNGG